MMRMGGFVCVRLCGGGGLYMCIDVAVFDCNPRGSSLSTGGPMTSQLSPQAHIAKRGHGGNLGQASHLESVSPLTHVITTCTPHRTLFVRSFVVPRVPPVME
jgi:hypothetical protein